MTRQLDACQLTHRFKRTGASNPEGIGNMPAEFDLALGHLIVQHAERLDPLEIAQMLDEYADRMHEKSEREASGTPAQVGPDVESS